jgi:type IV secretory pathway VirJ component
MCVTGALAVAGTALALGETQIKADAAKASTNYNLALADTNKKMIADQTDFAVFRHTDAVQRVLGSQRAGYGASGVTMEGTPTNVAVDTATQGEIDRLAIIYGGDVKQAGLDSEKATTRFRGQMAEAGAQLQMTKTLLGAADSQWTPGEDGKKGKWSWET